MMLSDFIESFKLYASTQAPKFLSTHECLKETVVQTDRAILQYIPCDRCTLKEAKNALLDNLEMMPIYTGLEQSVIDGGRTCCVCTRKTSELMVRVFVKTGIDNIVMSTWVTIYESIEQMVLDIVDDLNRHIRQHKCHVETPVTRIYAEFMP